MADEHILATQPRGSRKESAQEQQKRLAEAAAAGDTDGSAKRPKPPPSPTDRWEEKYRSSLLNVREEQATLYDPKRGFRCCRGFDRYMSEPAVFDHEEESTARIARPLDTIPDSERHFLKLALGLLYVKVSASDVGFPINVFGTVLMRDDLDFKCIYLFRRDRDNFQVINSPDEMLILTGPDRGPFDADVFYFEINLKIKGDEETTDRIFSRTRVAEDYPLDQWTKKEKVSSWLSTLELAYRSVHCAVEATVGVNILRGPREFYGSLTARTSDESTEMVLYDSERWGASAVGADGSVALPRRSVVLRENEHLILKIFVFGHGCRVLKIKHSDRSFDIKRGPYQLLVKVSLSGIWSRT